MGELLGSSDETRRENGEDAEKSGVELERANRRWRASSWKLDRMVEWWRGHCLKETDGVEATGCIIKYQGETLEAESVEKDRDVVGIEHGCIMVGRDRVCKFLQRCGGSVKGVGGLVRCENMRGEITDIQLKEYLL